MTMQLPRFPQMPRRIALLFLLLAACSLLASAQSDIGGAVAGQVAGIAGSHFRALITLRNTENGNEFDTFSDSAGNFRFPEVAPGSYTLRVSAPGNFSGNNPTTAPWLAYNVQVEVGRTTLLNPGLADRLHRAAINSAPVQQFSLSSAVGNNVDGDFMQALPNDSGRWSAFAALAGGVVSGIGPDAAGSANLSFRGLSPLLNAISVDGADHTLAFRGGQRGAATGGYALARGAVSQFQVHTSNFSAEYGRAGGGVINSVTRSGGNALHFEASFRDRDAAWGAMNAYSKVMQPLPAGTRVSPLGSNVLYLNGQPITYVDKSYNAPDRRLESAFNAGGPVIRNKLFWFFASEYNQRDNPAVARANEPETFFAAPSVQTIQTLAARLIKSTNPIYTGCAQSPPNLDLQALCAYSTVLNQLNGILGGVPRTTRQTNLFPRLDWRVNNRIQIIGQYSHMQRTASNGVVGGTTRPDGIGSFGNGSTTEDTGLARLQYFFTPNALTSMRYQYSRSLLSQLAAAPTAFEQQFAHNSLGRAPQISIDRSSGFTFGTLSSQNKSEYPLEIRQQFTDSITWIHHHHAFRIGYDYNHVADSVNGMNSQNGSYSYSSLANFVADMLSPDSCDGTTAGAGTYPCYRSYRQTLGPSIWSFETADYAAFAADDWKLTPRFTLSLGLRYDFERLPDTNKHVVNPDIPQTGYLPQDRNNFGPRAGFAWNVFGRGHTVLRGGFGLYYARISNATVFSALTSTGSAHSARSYFFRPLDIGAPQFPYVFAGNETPYVNPAAPDAFSSKPNAVYFDKHFQNPQIDQADLSLEQRIGRRSTITVSYMASMGHELPQFLDRNVDLSAVANLNYVMDFSTNPQHLGPIKNNFTIPFYYQRVNPNYGAITDIISETNSRYQGAVIRFATRRARALHLSVAYTFSHAIDDNQNEATFASFSKVYDPAQMQLEHGTSNFDVRQRVSGGIVARAPWRLGGVAGRLFNGYSVSTLGRWRTGLPYTMRTMGPIPTPLCSNYAWLNAGGPNGGSNCLKFMPAGGGIILDGARPAPGIGPSLNGYGGEDLVPQVGRNTFRYPATVGLDLRISKRTSIKDRVGVEFFADAFNVLNHANVTNIQTIGYKVENQSPSSSDPAAATEKLAYLSGLRTFTTVNSLGNPQTQLIEGPTAGFGDFTNFNSSAIYSDRRIQLGCRLSF